MAAYELDLAARIHDGGSGKRPGSFNNMMNFEIVAYDTTMWSGSAKNSRSPMDSSTP